jgi:peptidoglycan/LPS O-acetylase OafA/YrhL
LNPIGISGAIAQIGLILSCEKPLPNMAKRFYIQKLDAIRGAACLYILLHNFVYGLYGKELVSGNLKLLFSAGQEVVIIFFILSGFVVRLSLERHPKTLFRTFFVRRFRRIYFPLVITFLVSLAIAALRGKAIEEFSWYDLAGNLLLLQDFGSVKPGTWFYPFLGNLPLWFLSYEWWFYLMFYPAYKYLPKNNKRIYLIVAFSMLFYGTYVVIPNQIALILSYFILWWVGVECAEVFLRDRTFTYRNLQPIFIGLGLAVVATSLPLFWLEDLKPGYYPFLIFRHFFSAWLGLGVGLVWYRYRLVGFDLLVGKFAAIAPISYSLYLLSYPILVQWGLNSFSPKTWFMYVINAIVLFALAYLTEIKWQPRVNRCIK